METPQPAQYVLDMCEVVVKAGWRTNVNVQPREAFRPARLKIILESLDCAGSFTVDEVSVRGTILWRGPAPTPLFVGEGVSLAATRVVTPSEFVTVSVTNGTTVDRVFRGEVSGPLAP
jgi:hypothetical protein